MAITINTNVMSLNAQRNLGTSQSALSKSMQRLSSGLRINSAKDDAAGLAISDRMTAQIRGLNQASRNANDGISLAQTAEGALQESTNILQRIRELAVQSANDTNSDSDRTSLQAEVSQLISEMDRIASTTQFNGKTLLDGTMTDATFQVGANAGADQTISFSIDDARTSALGVDAYVAGTAAVAEVAATGAGATNTTLTFTADTAGTAGNAISIEIVADGSSATTGEVSVSGTTITVGADAASDIAALTTADIAALINGNTDAAALVDAVGTTDAAAAEAAFTLAGGVDAAAAVASSGTALMGNVSVASRDDASVAIASVDLALEQIDEIRGGLGAVQNRFESTIANLNNVAENLSAARSRILDADIAQETSEMTKQNILQQAGVSILAQANQVPQLALSLLGG
ncbi:MAG: flagellin [Deltaproteobacteria bacterium]|nr:flagellin [Deltaproteobacteria bacterium]